MAAFDAATDDETLTVYERRLTELPVWGDAMRDPARDAFWGSIVIDLEPHEWIPIPSVAADARILSYRVEPPATVSFARDSADNHYVSSPTGGRHRLVWLTDAAQGYFAGPLGGGRLADLPRALLHRPPARLRRHAAQLLEQLGVYPRPKSTVTSVLEPLIAYFRSFEVGPLPPPGESGYLDLARARKGLCRHRAYAFAITAMAAGLAARYVENELHAFVEVYLPESGWRRIDLGGAVMDEEVRGASGTVPYRPRGEDQLPTPSSFSRSDRTAPPTNGGASKWAAPSATATLPTRTSTSTGTTVWAGTRTETGTSASAWAGTATTTSTREESVVDHRARTQVTLEMEEATSFRGDAVTVHGRVSAAGADPGGLTVEILLGIPGGVLSLGEAVTRPDGSYQATLEVPGEAPLGNHIVFARTAGDDRRGPSASDGAP
jgi:transglutaminase-like putative cysteine protease